MATADIPKVSVLMCVYNGEKYLREAIDSILNQTFRDFEFIIVDDGSTDSTPQILRSYDDPRIVLLRNEQNLGLTKSLNRGLAATRGEYIARMDADDVSLPERLEKQVALLDERPRVGLVGCHFYQIDGEGKIVNLFRTATENDELQETLLKWNPFCHGAAIFRKGCIDEVGPYDESFVVVQDYDLWLRIAERYELFNVGEPLFKWRKTAEAISVRRSTLQYEYLVLGQSRAIQRRFGALLALQFPQPEIAAGHYLSLACHHYILGNIEGAIEKAAMAVRLRPALLQDAPAVRDSYDLVAHVADTFGCRTSSLPREEMEAAEERIARWGKALAARGLESAVLSQAEIVVAFISYAAGDPVQAQILGTDAARRDPRVHAEQILINLDKALPWVSIVTPSYNQARFIEETIRSVKDQTYPLIEHLVIDGGSTDGTVDILRRYDDVITWVSEPDRGQSEAINKGLQRARGEIVAWLNSDDTYTPNTISAAVGYFYTHPEVDMIYGDINFVGEDGSFQELWTTEEFSLARMFLEPSPIPQPAAFMRKKVLREVGLVDVDLHYVMDYELWLRIARRFTIRRFPYVAANFRRHGEAKSADSIPFWEEILVVFDKLFAEKDLPPEFAVWEGSARANAYASLSWLYNNKQGKWAKAAFVLLKAAFVLPKAVRLDPSSLRRFRWMFPRLADFLNWTFALTRRVRYKEILRLIAAYIITFIILPALGALIFLVAAIASLPRRLRALVGGSLARAKKPILLYTTFMEDHGGGEHQLTLLALGLKKRGYDPVVSVERPVEPGNPYRCRLVGAGIPLICANKWLYQARIAYNSLFWNGKLPLGLNNRHEGLGAVFFRLIHAELTAHHLLQQPRLIHVNRSGGYHAIRWGLCAHLPVVYSEMGTPVAAFPFWDGLKFTINEASAVIALSQASAEGLRDHCGVSGKVDVIPSMVEDSERQEPNCSHPGNDLVVGCSGRLSPEKGHKYLLQAAARVARQRPDVRFLITGDGPSREDLEKLARELGLGEQVTFLGFIDEDRFRAFLSEMDVFALSSTTEGVPITIIEAMAYGKPVVATAVGGVPELVQNGVTGLLVPPQRSDLLAEAILRLADDGALRRAMGVAGRALYEQRYRPDVVVEQILAVYERVAPE